MLTSCFFVLFHRSMRVLSSIVAVVLLVVHISSANARSAAPPKVTESAEPVCRRLVNKNVPEEEILKSEEWKQVREEIRQYYKGWLREVSKTFAICCVSETCSQTPQMILDFTLNVIDKMEIFDWLGRKIPKLAKNPNLLKHIKIMGIPIVNTISKVIYNIVASYMNQEACSMENRIKVANTIDLLILTADDLKDQHILSFCLKNHEKDGKSAYKSVETAAPTPVKSTLICRNGVFYQVHTDGLLKWHRHLDFLTGGTRWAENSGAVVGNGWAELRDVFCGDPGIVYAVDEEGNLLWYKHDTRETGTSNLDGGSQYKVGRGWQGFNRIFSGQNGVIYGIQNNGDLIWYAHSTWASGKNPADGGIKIGNGWGGFVQVFSAGEGVIYGLERNGTLKWYKHKDQPKSSADFERGGPSIRVNSGWPIDATIAAAGDGVIYIIQKDRTVLWWKHVDWRQGGPTWIGPFPVKPRLN